MAALIDITTVCVCVGVIVWVCVGVDGCECVGVVVWVKVGVCGCGSLD